MSKVIGEFKGDYAFLSNFYTEAPFTYYGLEIKTGEHLFNALKTCSASEANLVLGAKTPALAKKLGQTVTLKENWDDVERYKAMRITVGAKFLGNPDMIQKLLATGDDTLIEKNTWHDNVWGICICKRSSCSGGNNRLGLLLMELRDDLRKWK